MVRLNENSIENFIRENRDKFSVCRPPDSHLEKFFLKINLRIRHIVNIIPYLIRVAVATVIIFIASVLIWNNYIRKDRHEVTLLNKITLVINKITSH